MEKPADALLYWKNYLSGYSNVIDIPFKLYPPESSLGQEEAVETIELTGNSFTRISDCCNNIKISTTTFIQAIWGFLLAKYNNTQDVVFASAGQFPVAIPVRVKFNPEETIADFLKRIHQEVLASHDHLDIDLPAIQSQSEPGKDLINHMIVFEYAPVLYLPKAEDDYNFKIITSGFTSSIKIEIRFNKHIYHELLIKNTVTHLSNLIQLFSDDMNKQLKNIVFLSHDEIQEIIVDFNNTTVPYPRHKTITDLFEEQVIKTPDNTAILREESVITYDELNKMSNQLADYLINNAGIVDGDVIAVKLERSEFLVISIFGILKAGAVYLPIDKKLQQQRITYIKEDSGYKLIIDEKFIELFIDNRHKHTEENRSRKNKANDIAYIIYTSGTTGMPKGTLIEHHSLVNRLCWMQKSFSLSADDTILQKTTCSFDVSVWELLWWSIAGAKVVFLKDGYEKDPEQIIQYITRYAVSVLHFVPSMLTQFLDFIESDGEAADKLVSLKRVYTSGEALTSKINRQFHELFANTVLINLYGPTEATIDVTWFRCEQGLDVIPIGKPIDNTRIYILDNQQHIVPVGVEGTIFLAGAGLSRGYLNKPELTAQRFLNDPFSSGERMYDTGDIGKWMPDGNIEYIGRNDDQVKIRGFRIEPGEIIYHLERISGISVAHVLKSEEKLVAFLLLTDQTNAIPDTDFEVYTREELLKSLPEYMIPHHFCRVKEIPLSSSGKADKKQLLHIFQNSKYNNVVAKATKTLTGKSLEMAQIWAEVLGIAADAINPEKGFIEHGGDSLSMLKVVAMCKKRGYPISVKDFLRAPYINFLEGMSINEGKEKKKNNSRISELQQDAFVLSPIQQFFFDNNKQGLKFLMHASYYINKSFSLEGIRRSMDNVIEEHSSFRLRFKRVKGSWQQQYDFDDIGYILETNEFSAGTASLKSCIDRAMEVIDIEKGPMLYGNIFFKDDQPVLFLACHHLVMDAVSWKIFIDDLQINYIKNNMLATTAGYNEADYANL